LFFEFVTAPTETSTPPTVIVKDEGDCTTSGVVATPPTSATGCVGFSRSKEFGDSGNRGIVDDVVVTTCSVVVRGTDGALAIDVPDGAVLDVVVLDVVVVVDVVVELTAAETERDVRGPS
jgi:hypothetical protein